MSLSRNYFNGFFIKYKSRKNVFTAIWSSFQEFLQRRTRWTDQVERELTSILCNGREEWQPLTVYCDVLLLMMCCPNWNVMQINGFSDSHRLFYYSSKFVWGFLLGFLQKFSRHFLRITSQVYRIIVICCEFIHRLVRITSTLSSEILSEMFRWCFRFFYKDLLQQFLQNYSKSIL